MESAIMALKKFFLLSVAVAFIGGGCSSAPTSTEVNLAPGFNWYENKESGFAMQYPIEWEKTETQNPSAPIQFLSPLESVNDVFRENVNVGVGEKLAQDFNFEDILSALEPNIQNFKLESKTTETIPMGEAKTVVYTTSLKNGEKTYDLKIRQTYVRGKNHYYVITYTAEAAGYDKFAGAADSMIKSFKNF